MLDDDSGDIDDNYSDNCNVIKIDIGIYRPCGMVGALRRNTFNTGGSDGGKGSCFLKIMMIMILMNGDDE